MTRFPRSNCGLPHLLTDVLRQRARSSGGEHGDQNAGHENRCANGEGHEYALGNSPAATFDTPNWVTNQGKLEAIRANANDQRLQHKSIAPLLVKPLSATKARNGSMLTLMLASSTYKPAAIHNRCCKDKKSAMELNTARWLKERPSPTWMPRVVAQMSNDGLNNQTRQRSGNQKHGNLILARPKRLKNA